MRSIWTSPASMMAMSGRCGVTQPDSAVRATTTKTWRRAEDIIPASTTDDASVWVDISEAGEEFADGDAAPGGFLVAGFADVGAPDHRVAGHAAHVVLALHRRALRGRRGAAVLHQPEVAAALAAGERDVFVVHAVRDPGGDRALALGRVVRARPR